MMALIMVERLTLTLYPRRGQQWVSGELSPFIISANSSSPRRPVLFFGRVS